MLENIQQALEIVKAQAGFRSMTEEEISSMISALASTINNLNPETAPESVQGHCADIGKALKEKSITCLECGKAMKIITKKHLLAHGLNPDEYREKWGYAKGTPLVCKGLQRERRKKMKDMKLWEKRRKDVAA